ncbi:hypothetical protein GCM10010327_08270 [Streptomyces nitrosporeus]|nr:hypothetical protein GCM10010327_08270 [Streptomyces nitrosporeus]
MRRHPRADESGDHGDEPWPGRGPTGDPAGPPDGENTVYHYELHRLNATELILRADRERTARTAVRARRAARATSGATGEDGSGGRVNQDPGSFARAA